MPWLFHIGTVIRDIEYIGSDISARYITPPLYGSSEADKTWANTLMRGYASVIDAIHAE